MDGKVIELILSKSFSPKIVFDEFEKVYRGSFCDSLTGTARLSFCYPLIGLKTPIFVDFHLCNEPF